MVRSFLPKFSSKSERRLLALCKNNPKDDLDTQKWNKSAVQYIVKKFKKNLDILDELERAISQECSNTKCVPIPKTTDNRLLVSHRRGLPQVIYCRLWRWPDLQSHHQIQAISTCESSVGVISGVEQPLRLYTVCVNPYHYERKKPQSLDPVLVPASRIPPDLSTSFEDSDPTGGTKAIPNRFGPSITPAGATVRSLLSLNPIVATSREPRSSLRESASTEVGSSSTNNPLPPPPPPLTRTISTSTSTTVTFDTTPTTPTSSQAVVHSNKMEDQQQQQQQQQPQQPAVSQPQQQIQHPPPLPPQQQYQPVHHQQHVQQLPEHQLQQQYGGQQPQQPVQQQYPQHPVVDQFHEYSAPQLSHPSRQPQRRFDQPQYTIAMVNDPNIRQAIVDTPTEVVRPFQFKQPKFSNLARTMHDHDNYGPNSGYDPHGYLSQPFTYTQQQQQPQHQQQQQHDQYQQSYYTHQQQAQHQDEVQYQSYYAQQHPQQQHQQQQHHQQIQVGPSYPQQPQQMYSNQPAYSSNYPQQVSGVHYQQQEQPEMQVEYAPQVSQQNVFYQHQTAGPSQVVQDPSQIDLTEVPYVEGARWCSISYHEYDQRVGDKYQPDSYTVIVDGYTHPMCNDRFCVGGLSNVNRNQFTEWVRRRINRGVKFTYVDGDVYVECISDSSIFVSTPMLGIESGKDSPDKVTKVPSGGTVKVFSTPQFSKLLANAVPKGFEAVYKLTNYCSYKVSFLKGWGRNYKRHTIMNVPCWIEVQLNGPLQWIDKVLRQMRPPSQGCGSTS